MKTVRKNDATGALHRPVVVHVREHAGTHHLGPAHALTVADLPSPQVWLEREADLMLTIQQTAGGVAVAALSRRRRA